MLLFYVDECGDHSMATAQGDVKALKAGVSPYFVLSGVGVRDSSRRPLADALFEIKKRHFGKIAATSPWEATEIKGRYLFRAARSVAAGKVLEKPDGYRVLNTPAKVSGFTKDLGLIFDKYRPLTFTVAVDKSALLSVRPGRRVEPLGAAYAYMHQRIALSLDKLYAGESAILIADQQTQHEGLFRSGGLHQARLSLSRRLRMEPNFDLLVDKPLWVDTDLSSWDRELIQLADIVAYTTTACMLNGAEPVRECYLWPQIRSTLALHWRTGAIESGGFAIYPKSTSFPTAKRETSA